MSALCERCDGEDRCVCPVVPHDHDEDMCARGCPTNPLQTKRRTAAHRKPKANRPPQSPARGTTTCPHCAVCGSGVEHHRRSFQGHEFKRARKCQACGLGVRPAKGKLDALGAIRLAQDHLALREAALLAEEALVVVCTALASRADSRESVEIVAQGRQALSALRRHLTEPKTPEVE